MNTKLYSPIFNTCFQLFYKLYKTHILEKHTYIELHSKLKLDEVVLNRLAICLYTIKYFKLSKTMASFHKLSVQKEFVKLSGVLHCVFLN